MRRPRMTAWAWTRHSDGAAARASPPAPGSPPPLPCLLWKWLVAGGQRAELVVRDRRELAGLDVPSQVTSGHRVGVPPPCTGP